MKLSHKLYARANSRFWYVKIKLPNGDYYRESTGTENPVEAEKVAVKITTSYQAKLDSFLKEFKNGSPATEPGNPFTFGQMFDNYILHFQQNGFKSLKTSMANIKNITRFFGKKRPVETLTKQEIRDFVAKRVGVIANSTINRELAVLNRAMNLAAAEDFIDSELPENLQISKRKLKAVKRKIYPSIDEIKAISKEVPPWLKRLIFVASKIAWRKSELIELQWCDIRWEEGEIFLQAEKSKNGHSRNTPLFPFLFLLFKNMEREAHRKYGSHIYNEFVFEFPGDAQFYKEWRGAQKRLGMMECKRWKFRFHDLRRAGIKWLKMQGINENEIMWCYSGHLTRSIFDDYDFGNEDTTKIIKSKIKRLE